MSTMQETLDQILTDVRPPLGLITRPELYLLLGSNVLAQAEQIANLVLPGQENEHQRAARGEIFAYIVEFLHKSTFSAPVGAFIGKGRNLAARPYLAPTGLQAVNEHGQVEIGSFRFAEQYRWDTFFQNQLLILLNMQQMALDQLLNLVDVFNEYGRIPNALVDAFLSHAQPPLEGLAAAELLNSKSENLEPSDWYHQVMQVVEADLFTEWLDYESGRIHPRQDNSFVKRFGRYLSRHTSIHMHPLLVGCEDGKDHNLTTVTFGENYIPVQLNCLLWANVCLLEDYYTNHNANPEKDEYYAQVRTEMAAKMQKLFWVNNGEHQGFRNYAMGHDDYLEGPILYDDLAAEIWPLYVGLATPEQALITMHNLKKHYLGDIGLASTSPSLAANGTIKTIPEGWTFQWEENAWPPLMIIAVSGLERYSLEPGDEFDKFAILLKQQWVNWIEAEFKRSKNDPAHDGLACIHEKAPHDSRISIKPGYYGNLRGFGWTIASYTKFLHELAVSGNLK